MDYGISVRGGAMTLRLPAILFDLGDTLLRGFFTIEYIGMGI